nr:unnamed protein product [Digitaria exilis]
MAASNNPWRVPPPPLLNARAGLGDASLFSTSLPLLPHEKLNFPDSTHGTPSMDDSSAKTKVFDDDLEEKDYKFDFDLRQIDDLLPDEDEFFAGITDEVEPVIHTNNTEELEEFDVFGSGGGMELDLDPLENVTASFANSSIADGTRGNGISPFGVPSTVGTVAGEHPYGEHPSRTLFVRNINSNVEDSELRSLFEQYGDIRTLYTATKHRGFVMISYFDIRSARNAMRALQNKPLRRRKLDIHFSIPKENPSDKDLNQGTLVIFNLDPSVSNEEVRQIFGAYGEVKEIRETPNKKHHKFIEFYDVRAAEAALRSLNKSEIAGKRIKLEPSRPGGTRRNLMQQIGHDLDQEEPRSYRHPHVGSPMANSPPGAPFESHFGFLPESPETSFMKQIRFGNMGNIGTGRNGAGLMLNMAGRASVNPVSSLSGSLTDNSPTNFRPMLSPRLGQAFYGNPTYQGPGSFGLDSSIDRGRNRRVDSSALQTDSKRQYQLDLEKISKGDDARTTLMIKNIPNKYTSKMLLAAIDELHKGTYDFFYLPIDFKNKCNVGYAFINMISPTHIISFYQAFNGKKWEKFNSEKVASLAYARIQGRTALISHFQNSSLMNEDKRCRPILFNPNGLESGDQETFPVNGICIHMPVEGGAGDSLDDEDDVKMGGGESSMHMGGSL